MPLQIESMQWSGDSSQTNGHELEEQKHGITENVTEVIRKREQNLLEQEQKIHETVFCRIYEKHIGKEVWITSWLSILRFPIKFWRLKALLNIYLKF